MIVAAFVAALVVADEPLIVDDAPPAERDPLSIGGHMLLLGAADLEDAGGRDFVETVAGLELALAWEPSAGWQVAVVARLRHHLGMNDDDARGGFEPELRAATITWHASDEVDLEAGLFADVRWPRLVDPQPPDLWLGPLPATGEATDRRRPIPALRAVASLDDWRFEALWQPIFVAPRVPLVGTDWSPLGPLSELGPLFADDDFDELGDLDHPTGLDGGVVGLRATWRKCAWEAGLSWLWRWDPVPLVDGFRRQHVVGADVATTTGPVHWRADLAFEDVHTSYVDFGRATRDPAMSARLALSSTPVVFLDFELALQATVIFGDEPEKRVGSGPDDLDLSLRLTLLAAYDGLVRLDLEQHIALLRDDLQTSAAIVMRFAKRIEGALGFTVFDGNAMDLGPGALYDADDQVWLRFVVDL